MASIIPHSVRRGKMGIVVAVVVEGRGIADRKDGGRESLAALSPRLLVAQRPTPRGLLANARRGTPIGSIGNIGTRISPYLCQCIA